MASDLALKIRHQTVYAYVPDVTRVIMKLRVYPIVSDTQSVPEWHVTVNGEPVEANRRDGCHVGEGLWSGDGPLGEVTVIAEGTVQRTEDNGVVRGKRERVPPELFLRPTQLTAPNDAIRALADGARQDDPLSTLHALSAAVRDAIDYLPRTTDAGTQAADALGQGAGVCQDHAHVFIAAARHIGIPARYVGGYYLAGADGEDLRETHAWAEGHVEGLGWVGFDISNRTCPTPEHIRVSLGLDADHAALISGSIVGQAEETMTASVAISETQTQQ